MPAVRRAALGGVRAGGLPVHRLVQRAGRRALRPDLPVGPGVRAQLPIFHRVPREPPKTTAGRGQPADWPHQELAALALEGGAGPREEEAGGAGGGPGGPPSMWDGLRAWLDVVRASAAPKGPAQAAAGQQGLAMTRPLITNREAMASVGAHGSQMARRCSRRT